MIVDKHLMIDLLYDWGYFFIGVEFVDQDGTSRISVIVELINRSIEKTIVPLLFSNEKLCDYRFWIETYNLEP